MQTATTRNGKVMDPFIFLVFKLNNPFVVSPEQTSRNRFMAFFSPCNLWPQTETPLSGTELLLLSLFYVSFSEVPLLLQSDNRLDHLPCVLWPKSGPITSQAAVGLSGVGVVDPPSGTRSHYSPIDADVSPQCLVRGHCNLCNWRTLLAHRI